MKDEKTVRQRLQKNAYRIHLAAFFLIVLPAAGLLYNLGASNNPSLTWLLLGLIIFGNILVLLVN